MQLILLGAMVIFAGVAIYFSFACLRNHTDKNLFIFAVFAVLLLGLASFIVGYINSVWAFRYPMSVGHNWDKRQWVYFVSVLIVTAATLLSPTMMRRNTIKIWERMEREKFNKRKNTNTPRYCPVVRSSLV